MSNAILRPGNETIEQFIDGLATCGNHMDHNDLDKFTLYKEMQNAAISIPNHAKYFSDLIESMYVADENGQVLCNNKVSRRTLFMDTMHHLPSPKMLQLLGHYLYDERDKRPKEFDYLGASSNADYACGALLQIGLKNPPLPRQTGRGQVEGAMYDKDLWKLWWEQVQAGTRSFSFEGQDVEYRFKKDGTWITTPLTSKAVPGDNKSNATGLPGQAAQHDRRPWYWLIGIVLITATGLLWQKRKSALG